MTETIKKLGWPFWFAIIGALTTALLMYSDLRVEMTKVKAEVIEKSEKRYISKEMFQFIAEELKDIKKEIKMIRTEMK